MNYSLRSDLAAALERPVHLDGAMNTELSRKGLVFNTNEWLEVNIDSPESIANIHAAYARAGACVYPGSGAVRRRV